MHKKKFLLLVREKELFKKCLKKMKAEGIFCSDPREFIQNLYLETPESIIIDLELEHEISIQELLESIKKIEFLREVPILILCSKERLYSLDLTKLQIDDFLVYPLDEIVCIKALEVMRARSKRTLDANPLTKLPGNTSIINKIQELIEQKKDFALGYVDLNNFKAYNDKYGFLRGDEVIKMLARILVNSVNQIQEDTFVGHIGGDDFVFIVPPSYAESISDQVITYFDRIIPFFYDDEDLRAGKIISKDRQGNIKEFPIMSVAIAIVMNTQKCRFKHYGEVVRTVAEVKEFVKKNREKSSYAIDRRVGS
ncbi:MAG: diguanylate cyclase response regulator [Deltaproteobacteria bacterium]|nr:MAG: diguanylate cyclase response regulator [Deltaproteobacteria bacterium]